MSKIKKTLVEQEVKFTLINKLNEQFEYNTMTIVGKKLTQKQIKEEIEKTVDENIIVLIDYITEKKEVYTCDIEDFLDIASIEKNEENEEKEEEK